MQDTAYRDAYYREVVAAVGARCVIATHWDDFTLSLDEPLRPMPRLLDDFEATMEFLRQRVAPDATLALLPFGRPVPLLGPGAVACGPAR
jgi:hypothetical protein